MGKIIDGEVKTFIELRSQSVRLGTENMFQPEPIEVGFAQARELARLIIEHVPNKAVSDAEADR